MIHPHTELRFISPEKGYGIVATQLIPKGTITWILDPLDRVFRPEQVKKLPGLFQDILNKYTYRDQNGDFVLCWDNARFVNHSFVSNCMSTAYNFELAIRDIYPGEELTDDYGYLNVTEPIAFPKEDGSDRIKVYPDDLLRYHAEWDEKLRDAFTRFNDVPQPLCSLVDAAYKAKVTEIADGKAEMDSILNCYCHNTASRTIAA